MITIDMRIEAINAVTENWGDEGLRVIKEAGKVKQFNGNTSAFLSHCTACGGNWGGMLLTGIRELYPAVYNAIPDDMGIYAFSTICYTMMLCGVDTSC